MSRFPGVPARRDIERPVTHDVNDPRRARLVLRRHHAEYGKEFFFDGLPDLFGREFDRHIQPLPLLCFRGPSATIVSGVNDRKARWGAVGMICIIS